MNTSRMLESPSDAALISRIASGDADAVSTLFERRQQNVYRFVLHLTGSPAIADDVTQEVFLAVIRDAGRFEPGRAAATAWLCGIARNHVRRRLAAERRAESLADDELLARVPGVTQDPLEDLTSAEGLEILRRSLLSLPLKYREPIVLCDLQEMPYAEAAVVLDCPVGTLKSRLNRGRALLAAKVQAAGPAPQRRRMTRCLA